MFLYDHHVLLLPRRVYVLEGFLFPFAFLEIEVNRIAGSVLGHLQ